MKELSSEKNAKYQKIYKKNLKKYKNSKVELVWVGKTCNLRCRDCLHMIPYIKQKKLEVSRLIGDCKRLLELCSINYFSIAGGEPFCCKNLFELIDFVTESADIKDGKIVTNGTVVPEERTIDALRRMKGKLEIISPSISAYFLGRDFLTVFSIFLYIFSKSKGTHKITVGLNSEMLFVI